MTKLTDEILMAYVDGELDEKETNDVSKAIEADPKVQKRIEIFTDSAAMLQGVYDAPLHEAVPKRLLKAIGDSESGKPPRKLFDRIADFLRMPAWQPAYALMASFVLLIGIGAGYLASEIINPNKAFSPVALNSEKFSRGLETTASGQTFNIADRALQVTPVSTFLDKSQRYCRQYEQVIIGQNGEKSLSHGIACRDASGNWHTMIYIAPHSAGKSPANSTEYITAGDEDLIDTMVSRLMASPPLAIEEEAKLINQAWEK